MNFFLRSFRDVGVYKAGIKHVRRMGKNKNE